jgi:hypothetical protein
MVQPGLPAGADISHADLPVQVRSAVYQQPNELCVTFDLVSENAFYQWLATSLTSSTQERLQRLLK